LIEETVEVEGLVDDRDSRLRANVWVRRHDHRRRLAHEAKPFRLCQHPRARFTGHRVVAQHQPISIAAEELQAFVRRRCLVHVVSFEGERRRDHPADILLILDYEQTRSLRGAICDSRVSSWTSGEAVRSAARLRVQRTSVDFCTHRHEVSIECSRPFGPPTNGDTAY
jgi:hypothetical protein